MSDWKRETPIEGGHGGYQHAVLPLGEGGAIAVGFGSAQLVKNRELIFAEERDDTEMSFDDAEKLAAADPDNDWRIHLIAPLSERHYQRQGDGHWVLYEKGMGFA